MKKLTLLIVLSFSLASYGPPNCNLYEGDCKQACLKSEQAISYGQGSPMSQRYFDESISICKDYDYSYYEKAVPFAKRGLIAEWKELIDEAIRIDSAEHLANRGWYSFFFLNHYEAAIKDIEALKRIKKTDIGDTGDATYHLEILRGICYAELGEYEKALEIIETQLAKADHYVSLYDYLCLGYVHLRLGNKEAALQAFTKQEVENDLADNKYYKHLILMDLGQLSEAKKELDIAKQYYAIGQTMENPYRELPFEVYQADIDNALAAFN